MNAKNNLKSLEIQNKIKSDISKKKNYLLSMTDMYEQGKSICTWIWNVMEYVHTDWVNSNYGMKGVM